MLSEGGGVGTTPLPQVDSAGGRKRFRVESPLSPGQFFEPLCNKNNYKPIARFLIASHGDPERNLSRVSPFLINKMVNYTAGSEVRNIKKLKNGTLFIETLADSQTLNLLKMTQLSQEIPITIKVHEKLNHSKGVIFCKDLVEFSLEEIKEELKEQNVIEVYRVAKFINGEKKETPLHILTFDTPTLPFRIKAGFYNLEVRPYLPSPMRCRRCHILGHTVQRCPSEQNLCIKCGSSTHSSEQCVKDPVCVNCNGDHLSNSNKCPKYEEEKEILAIASKQKISYFSAKKQFDLERNKNKPENKSYSQAAKSYVPCASCVELKKVVSNLTEQISALTKQINYLLKNQSVEQNNTKINFKPNEPLFNLSLPSTSKTFDQPPLKDGMHIDLESSINSDDSDLDPVQVISKKTPSKLHRKNKSETKKGKGKAKLKPNLGAQFSSPSHL